MKKVPSFFLLFSSNKFGFLEKRCIFNNCALSEENKNKIIFSFKILYIQEKMLSLHRG